MQPRLRNIVGSFPSLFWIGTGPFMISKRADANWRLVGWAVVAVGIGRAALLLRDWNKHKSAE